MSYQGVLINFPKRIFAHFGPQTSVQLLPNVQFNCKWACLGIKYRNWLILALKKIWKNFLKKSLVGIVRGDSSFVLYIFGQICLRSFRTVGLGISSVKWPSDQNCIRIQHTKSKNWLWPRNAEIKVELTLFRHFFKNFGWLLEIFLEALSP